jgi:hypothetical protein
VSNPLLREGPIPVLVHGVIEYAAGILFIAAPLLFDYEDSTATGVSVAVGILILIMAAVSAGPTGLVKAMSVSVHVVIDFVLAVALIAAPFLLGFSEDIPPTVFFIAAGVAHLLITVGTTFERDRRIRREPTGAVPPLIERSGRAPSTTEHPRQSRPGSSPPIEREPPP